MLAFTLFVPRASAQDDNASATSPDIAATSETESATSQASAAVAADPVEQSQATAWLPLLGPTFELTSPAQWFVLLVCIFIAVVIGKVIQISLRRAAKFHLDRQCEIRSLALESAASPASLTALAIGLILGLRFIYMEPPVRNFSDDVVTLLLIIALGWFLFNLIDVIHQLLMHFAERTDSKLDDQLVPLVRKTLRIFLVIVFTLVIAQNVFGLDITGWLAGLGIAGLAVSLAAQDSIKNLFGSITVLFDKPFVIGDWVVTDAGGTQVEGIVEEIGFRSTRIRTFYNSRITLPNANLISAVVDNYGLRQYRRWKTHIGVQYDTPPDKLLAFTEGIRELVRTHPYTRKDYYQVWMHQWSSSSMDVLLYIFFEVPDWNTELRERERMFIDIVRLADQLGVQFAFPTQTVHLFREQHPDPDSTHQPNHNPPDNRDTRHAGYHGIRAAQKIIQHQQWLKEKPGPQTYTQFGMTPLDDAGNEKPPETQ